MGLLVEIGIGALAFVLVQLVVLTTLNALSKRSTRVWILTHGLTGLMAALVLQRLQAVSIVTVLLLAVALWIASRHSDHLMGAEQFRLANSVLVGHLGMTAGRVALVALLVVPFALMDMQICSGPLSCHSLIANPLGPF